jgi:hypothetical protein
MGVKSVTRIGNGTLFQVKHYSGSEYETSAEAAAGKIIEEVGPLLDDTSAGLAYLSESLERASKTDIGGLTQWVLGLIRGLQTRTTAVQLDLLVAMAVLETFEESEDHTKSHGNNHRL